jgi:hypothetical protein
MTGDDRLAAGALSWTAESWDRGLASRVCGKWWRDLEESEATAATVLGYTNREWDAEKHFCRVQALWRGRLMRKLAMAKVRQDTVAATVGDLQPTLEAPSLDQEPEPETEAERRHGELSEKRLEVQRALEKTQTTKQIATAKQKEAEAAHEKYVTAVASTKTNDKPKVTKKSKREQMPEDAEVEISGWETELDQAPADLMVPKPEPEPEPEPEQGPEKATKTKKKKQSELEMKPGSEKNTKTKKKKKKKQSDDGSAAPEPGQPVSKTGATPSASTSPSPPPTTPLSLRRQKPLVLSMRPQTADAAPSAIDAKLAQKLGQLQPSVAVFPQECVGQLASFGPS